jgi:hypothetical protein
LREENIHQGFYIVFFFQFFLTPERSFIKTSGFNNFALNHVRNLIILGEPLFQQRHALLWRKNFFKSAFELPAG